MKYPRNGYDARFRRREPAGQNAAEEDDRDHQRKRCIERGVCDNSEGGASAPKADRPEKVAVDHQAKADHQPGNDARHEKTGD